MPADSDLPGWRQRFAATAPADARTPLGMLFQLRRLTRPGSQWTAPRAETASSTHAEATYRLAVRPVTRSAKGNWVSSEVTWSSMGFRVERSGLDARHVRWFAQFAALHRSSSDAFRAQETDWLYLDDFASPLLWPLLDDARGLGIPFVSLASARRPREVAIEPPARVTVDVRGAAGDILLRRRVLVGDDEELPVTGVVGDHGVYSATFGEEGRVRLAPVEAGEVAVIGGDALVVPAADADEFWSDFYPVLVDRAEVASTDVELPAVRERAVLIVEFDRRDVVLTRWESRAGALRRPLDDPPVEVAERMDGGDAAEFVARTIPALEKDGIRVEVLGDPPPYRELTEVPRLILTAVESDKRDWLELGFLVTVGERTIPFKKLFVALSRGRTKLLLPDKSYLSLDQPVFDALRDLIAESAGLDEWETGPRISRYRADLLEPFEDLADEHPDAHAWRAAAAALTTTPAPIDQPAALLAELRPYQLDGVRWLAHLWQHGLGGVLADDMGLGKTLQVIGLMAHVAATRAAGERQPFLVVAPTSVVDTWARELASFAPSLRVDTIADTRQQLRAEADVVLVSYAVFRLVPERFQARSWEGLVLDEAQFVKNPATRVHECAQAIDARVTIAVTGTPLENSLVDLWALFRLVAPGLFASRIRFVERFISVQKPERIAELRRRIRPLMLRRTKELVAADLPPKQDQVLMVDLAPEHRDVYEGYLQRERQKLLGLVEDLDRNRFIVFRSLTLLRMLALDASLISDSTPDVPSSKLDVLVEQLDDVIAGGHRAIVFSQFTSYLGLVRDRLGGLGIETEYLDGSTVKRDEVVTRFRSGTAPVFLVSLRAGGFGLTLTEADYVFLLDPWWNPAAESQAIDRAHRIGQTRTVMIYRLVARDTIEEKVLALGDAKRRLFEQVVDDESAFSAPLTADDIRGLLG
ncbi:MAG: DEAD/DEAH box helicase [Microbacteriaceae bacterium]